MYYKPTVFVAMSGGVDSSLAAALLKKQGYNVFGVFMINWTDGFPTDNQKSELDTHLCLWEKDQLDMQKVCKKLKIPYYTFNFKKEYQEKVVTYFFNGYKKGITPNPDIRCNQEIKFKLFLKKSLKMGADFIATGHYARIGTKTIAGKKIFTLLKGKDPIKDQSYFLYPLNQDQLSHTLFPIGGYHKKKVRALAKKLKLPTHARKDSQGICFIGEINLEDFLRQKIKPKPGKIITTNGKIIGKHNGLPFFTIGQRKGIKVGGGIPYYVAAKDIKTNTLIVAKGNQDPALYQYELVAANLHFIVGRPKFPLKCYVKIRYRQPDQKCTVYLQKDDKLKVIFKKPQRAITPGQSIVFYNKEEVLGGGIIQ